MSTTSDYERENTAAGFGPGARRRPLLPASLEEARAERLAKLALLLPERDARENEAVILELNGEEFYHLGMIDPGNFVGEKNVARLLGVETSNIETRRLEREEFERL